MQYLVLSKDRRVNTHFLNAIFHFKLAYFILEVGGLHNDQFFVASSLPFLCSPAPAIHHDDGI